MNISDYRETISLDKSHHKHKHTTTHTPSGGPPSSFVSPGKQGKWHILPLHHDVCGNQTSTIFPPYTGSFHEEQINTMKSLILPIVALCRVPTCPTGPKATTYEIFGHSNCMSIFFTIIKAGQALLKCVDQSGCIVLVVWLCSRTIPEQQSTWGPPHPWSDTNQLESNHYTLCQPTQINVMIYQTTFYEFIVFFEAL